MPYFKYLVIIIMSSDGACPVVKSNLQKAWKNWAWIMMILEQEGSNKRVLGTFFKEVVQKVIIFGSDTWVMKPRTGRYLGGFQHRVDLWITGQQPQKNTYGRC